MENINKLIAILIVIAEYSKGIHYSCHGEAFYSKHLLADRIYDGIYPQVDSVKETYFLGNEEPPLQPREYLALAAQSTPDITTDDKKNFEYLRAKILEAIEITNYLKELTNGERSLFDDISKDLQQKLGLVNLQVK